MKTLLKCCVAVLGLQTALAPPTQAQMKFLTAEQVKPILTATKGQWVAVREYDGADLLYFSHLLAWRCGLSTVLYSINGGPQRVWELGVCDEEAAQPNAIADDQPIFARMPLQSLQTIKIDIIYDDGTLDTATYSRKAIQIN